MLSVFVQCPLFQGVSEEELTAVLPCLKTRRVSYKKSETIFLEGQPVQDIGIVLSGEVHVIKEDYEGRRSVITSAQAGELFGEAFACAGVHQIPVSVVTAADSEIAFISLTHVLTSCSNACQFHSRIIQNLLRMIAEKNLRLNQKIDFMSQKTTKEKMLSYLFAQAKQMGSSDFSIPFDRQALADYLGVERSAMSAELSKLRREGKIDYYKNHFRLLQPSSSFKSSSGVDTGRI